MQQVKCIRARVGVEVGDVVEVPDGAQVSPLYFEPVAPPAAPPPAPPAPAPAAAKPGVTVKGGS